MSSRLRAGRLAFNWVCSADLQLQVEFTESKPPKVVGEARRLRPATTLTNHAASAARELESRYAVLFEGGGIRRVKKKWRGRLGSSGTSVRRKYGSRRRPRPSRESCALIPFESQQLYEQLVWVWERQL